MRRLLLSAVLTAVALAGLGAQEPVGAPATPAAINAAINKLGSFDYPVRTDAARFLRRVPPDAAVPLLAAAARSHTDEYVRYRALVLLAGLGDAAADPVMRAVMTDRNDRLRTVAFGWFEHHPDPGILPALVEALSDERSEFVRPALTRAVAAQASDPRARAALVPLIMRGEDLFRGAVIEALGDYGARYALPDITSVARLDGPLQDDAVTALGKLGDASTLVVLAALQRSSAPDLQPTLSAALCLLDVGCDRQKEYLKTTLTAAMGDPQYQALLRGDVHALAVLAVSGQKDALEALVEAGVPAKDPARAPIALAVGLVALRNPLMILDVLEARQNRGPAVLLIRDAFDMLSEDFEEERFYVAIRRAYWSAPDGSARREAARGLIETLEF